MKIDIVPKLIILLSAAVIIICVLRYITCEPEEIITYASPVNSKISTDAELTKYVLDESLARKRSDDVKMNNTKAQDTSELEILVEDLSKQAENSRIDDP